MNPIEKIENWLNLLPANFRKDMLYYASFFHPSKAVHSDDLNPEAKFMVYLKETDLSNHEIAFRTLMISRLIDFAFSGKRTEEDWTKYLDRNLSIAARAKEKGISLEPVNYFFDNYSEDKAMWMTKNKEWESFKVLELNDEWIGDWYFEAQRRSYAG
ncbi:MAG: hypothetical protein JWP12_1610 [Bacteroidetes bacterium]|nr:hypothetical protein [Bacteroidota bacterium]